MAEYEIWKFLHICMFVFWLGTDVGVMLCSKRSVDPNLGIEARFQMLEMALKIELLPRVMWVMALPFGVHLSATLGYIEPSTITLALMWIFTFAWLVINVGGAANLDKPFGQNLSKINRFIVATLGIGLIVISLSSFIYLLTICVVLWPVIAIILLSSAPASAATVANPDLKL